ncbi:MAG: preprotein translocase subunit SecG [Cytophagaceae bacterium]|jgi:preprotein translocase subunit SecG|nr:preprotein translocase subunit SecG [Cytophagaceae bacterium]
MYPVVIALIVIVCVLLILIVLVQNSKGGGLASNFSSSNQIMGVRKTADFLEKATWTLAGVLLVLSFVSVMVLPKGQSVQGSAIDEQIQNVTPPAPAYPSFPVGGEGEEGSAAETTDNSVEDNNTESSE